MSHPIARRADLIIQQAEPDTLVYDQLRDRAHSLGPVASFVFRNADGSRSVSELSAHMSDELGVVDDPELVSAALSELDHAHLLLPDGAGGGSPGGISRREAVRRFGTATLALTAVVTIAAPTPAMARSRGDVGGPPKPNKGKGPKSNPGKGPKPNQGKGPNSNQGKGPNSNKGKGPNSNKGKGP